MRGPMMDWMQEPLGRSRATAFMLPEMASELNLCLPDGRVESGFRDQWVNEEEKTVRQDRYCTAAVE